MNNPTFQLELAGPELGEITCSRGLREVVEAVGKLLGVDVCYVPVCPGIVGTELAFCDLAPFAKAQL